MTARILLVEDDPNLIVPLQYLLERNGYAVMAVSSGRQAIETLPTFRPDVVILDILLSDMDGFDTCQCLRSLPDGTRIRVIFLSAHAGAIDQAKALSCGADAYVQMPFSNQGILDTLNEVMTCNWKDDTPPSTRPDQPGNA
ncbi:MAG: response regulator [Desulfosarcinaceae bacterium]|nr:response regulator [Desulfosarcinaceae bacterium]